MRELDCDIHAEVLSPPPSAVSADHAAALARRHYGIAGRASALAGERDHNFLIRALDGAVYVFKISHPDQDSETVRFQNGALAHIAWVDPGLPVPVVMRDIDGVSAPKIEVGEGDLRIARLLTYLDGTLLHKTAPSADQDHNLGVFLARLGRALAEFPTAAVGHTLLWDLRHLARSRDMIGEIADATLRTRVENAYDECQCHALHALDELRTQAIHNDMNPYNVVMDAQNATQVRGMIDFGDMVRGALASDMAVGAAYRWTLREHPLAGVARFLRGYASVRPLEPAEIAAMFDLVRARLAMTINIANWQSLQFTENRDYALRLQPALVAALAHLSGITRSAGHRYLCQALR